MSVPPVGVAVAVLVAVDVAVAVALGDAANSTVKQAAQAGPVTASVVRALTARSPTAVPEGTATVARTWVERHADTTDGARYVESPDGGIDGHRLGESPGGKEETDD